MAKRKIIYYPKDKSEGAIDTSNRQLVRTPLGDGEIISTDQKEKFTGDLGGNLIEIVPEDLTIENVLKRVPTQELRFQFQVADQNFACPIYLSGSEDNNLQFVRYEAPPGFQSPYPTQFQFVGRKRFVFGSSGGTHNFNYEIQLQEGDSGSFDENFSRTAITEDNYTNSEPSWVTALTPSGNNFWVTGSVWTGFNNELVFPRAVQIIVSFKINPNTLREDIQTDTIIVEQDRFPPNVKLEGIPNTIDWNNPTITIQAILNPLPGDNSPFRRVTLRKLPSGSNIRSVSIDDQLLKSEDADTGSQALITNDNTIRFENTRDTVDIILGLTENSLNFVKTNEIKFDFGNAEGFEEVSGSVIQGVNMRIEAQYDTTSSLNLAYVASSSGSQNLVFYVTGSSFNASSMASISNNPSWLTIGSTTIAPPSGIISKVTIPVEYTNYTFGGSGIAIPREAALQFETTPPITVGDNPLRVYFQQEAKPPTLNTTSFRPISWGSPFQNAPVVGRAKATHIINFTLEPSGGIFRTFEITQVQHNSGVNLGLELSNFNVEYLTSNRLPSPANGFYDRGRITLTYSPPSEIGQSTTYFLFKLTSAFGDSTSESLLTRNQRFYQVKLNLSSANSLVAGTKVITDYINDDVYSTKNIEDLLVSDTIVSKQIPTLPDTDDSDILTAWTNNTLGDNTLSTTAVETINSSEDDTIININNGLLKLTSNHLVFVLRNEIWALLRAKDVKNNDLLRHIDGHNIKVTSVETETYTGTVYRIDVEELDVFYANGILIHNG